MVPGRLAVGGLGVAGGAYAVTKGPDAVQGFLNEAFPAWVLAARAALQAAPQVAPAAKDSAQVELLSASVKSLSAAVDGALRAQRTIVGGGAAGTLVLVGAPLAVLAYYLRNYGWWVTAQELQEGLDGVRLAVCERVEEARVQLLERIGVLEKLGEDTAAWQREVRCLPLLSPPPPPLSISPSLSVGRLGGLSRTSCSALLRTLPVPWPSVYAPLPHASRPCPSPPQQSAAMAEVAGKLQGVQDTVGTLEKRLEGVEGDVARSARGVELLCEFVASANAPSGEQERSLQERLQEFTQQPAARPALAPPDQPLPWARPPTTGYLSSVLSGRVSPN